MDKPRHQRAEPLIYAARFIAAREYGSRRAQLVSKDTKVGKTRVSG